MKSSAEADIALEGEIPSESNTGSNSDVRTHIEPIEKAKINPKGRKRVLFREDDQNMIELSRNIVHVVENDPAQGYETDRSHRNWLLLYIIATWEARVRVSFWAVVRFLFPGKDKRNPKLGNFLVRFWKSRLPAARRVLLSANKDPDSIRPRYSSIFFDRFSKPLRDIRCGSASWKALEIIYNWSFSKPKSLSDRIANFWIGMVNAQAVRNRHKLITKILWEEIKAKGKNRLSMLSVACGSAAAVLEVVKRARDQGVIIDLTLLDPAQNALDYATRVAKELGVDDHLTVICGRDGQVGREIQGSFDIVEMLGFLDYLEYDFAARLITRIRSVMIDGGTFFTCNIVDNFERDFLWWVISWPMLYRTPQKVGQIMLAAGFDVEKVRLISEPHQVHVIAKCEK